MALSVSESKHKDQKQPKRCFISYSRSRVDAEVLPAIESAARSAGYRPFRLDQMVPQGARLDEVMLGEIARADCVIADITDARPTVIFEIGSAMAMGKSVFFLCEEGQQASRPTFLGGYLILTYSTSAAGLKKLTLQLRETLVEYQARPQRLRRGPSPSTQMPFFVDWDRLDRPDAENLCRELLAQLGFQRADWFKESREIDLIAELPKKDPDGFEYRELWYVSMGRNAPLEMLLEMAQRDPEYLIHRALRHSDESSRGRDATRNPSTFLLIILDEIPSHARISEIEERSPIRRKSMAQGLVRIRIWDRNYLTSLIHQFPNLGYKYFSDEGRSASKYRKTPEELNQENVELAERLTLTVRQLEEEKSLRVRAERDAVWKDISFAAAHKLGNPIFAIETNLDPLERRINEQRRDDAMEVMTHIRASIEKAKAIIDQFKSLARAQQMQLEPVLLKPMLEASCEAMVDQGISFSIDCPSEVRVVADPEHLAECFDELIRNSLRWFDKPEKRIDVAVAATTTILPPSADPALRYALIHFRDNGPGIPLDQKTQIFDAFYTTFDHGTGLGLALVRRIIEGHKGVIIEAGEPGKGADFEIYLPLADVELDSRSKIKKSTERKRK